MIIIVPYSILLCNFVQQAYQLGMWAEDKFEDMENAQDSDIPFLTTMHVSAEQLYSVTKVMYVQICNNTL